MNKLLNERMAAVRSLLEGKRDWQYHWSFGNSVGQRAMEGGYALGLTIRHDTKTFDAKIGSYDGFSNNSKEIVSKAGFKTRDAAEKWIDKELKKIESKAKAKPEPEKPSELTLEAVASALKSIKTKTGGRMLNVYVQGGSYPSVSAEPEYRQRLDHYGSSDGDDEGWDDEGWEADYAGPLAQEIQKAMKARGFDTSKLSIDIGEKGHVDIQLRK